MLSSYGKYINQIQNTSPLWRSEPWIQSLPESVTVRQSADVTGSNLYTSVIVLYPSAINEKLIQLNKTN